MPARPGASRTSASVLAGLDRIQFIDFENGWVSGEVQHPLPRDPFLLATTDGGKTWQRAPSSRSRSSAPSCNSGSAREPTAAW
jgi:photosystem II stability/assembly factor-like uncharacterized protein